MGSLFSILDLGNLQIFERKCWYGPCALCPVGRQRSERRCNPSTLWWDDKVQSEYPLGGAVRVRSEYPLGWQKCSLNPSTLWWDDNLKGLCNLSLDGKSDARKLLGETIMARSAHPLAHDTFFSPKVLRLPPRQRSLFPQTPFLPPHLSNYRSDKTPQLS